MTQEVKRWLDSQGSLAASDEKLVYEYVIATVHEWATEGDALAMQYAFDIWFEWDRSLNVALKQAVQNSDTEEASLNPALRTKLPIPLDGTLKQAAEINEFVLAVLQAHTNSTHKQEYRREIERIRQDRHLEHLSQQEMDNTIAKVIEVVKTDGISIEEAAKLVLPRPSNVWSVDCQSAERKTMKAAFDPYRLEDQQVLDDGDGGAQASVECEVEVEVEVAAPFGFQVYQCQIASPGVGYRHTPSFADKVPDGTGPQSPDCIIATAMEQGPQAVFVKCSSGRGWLPLTNPGGSRICFEHLGEESKIDFQKRDLHLADGSVKFKKDTKWYGSAK